jgi:hypothetical protein
MVAVPAATPVTSPMSLTVALAKSLEAQVTSLVQFWVVPSLRLQVAVGCFDFSHVGPTSGRNHPAPFPEASRLTPGDFLGDALLVEGQRWGLVGRCDFHLPPSWEWSWRGFRPHC